MTSGNGRTTICLAGATHVQGPVAVPSPAVVLSEVAILLTALTPSLAAVPFGGKGTILQCKSEKRAPGR